MGIITIEVPQKGEKSYKIASKKKARDLIEELDQMAPKRKLRDLSSVFGMWADRTESTEQIARELILILKIAAQAGSPANQSCCR